MNTRHTGMRRSAAATTVIVIGSVVGLGIAFSTVAATIPALAGSFGYNPDNGSVGSNGGGLGPGFGTPHVRSGGS